MSNTLFKNDWISICPGFKKMNFRIGPASYFDDRVHISFCPTIFIPIVGMFFTGLSFWSLLWIPLFFVGYFQIYLNLPIHSGIDDSDPPEYGFYFYGTSKKMFDTLWICKGSKNKCIYMPWDWTWVRTSALKKDKTWEHETIKNKKDFYRDQWKNILWKETHPYVYTLKNGTKQYRNAEIKVEEREWRWRGLKWFPYIRKISKSIDVRFTYGGPFKKNVFFEKIGHAVYNKEETAEVGERTGSWKGGTIGCGYSMFPGETPLQTLRRMEKEREF